MPLYEYGCSHCGHRFEILQAMGADGEGLVCPACGEGGVEKQLSTFSGSVAGGRSAAPSFGGCCQGTPT